MSYSSSFYAVLDILECIETNNRTALVDALRCMADDIEQFKIPVPVMPHITDVLLMYESYGVEHFREALGIEEDDCEW